MQQPRIVTWRAVSTEEQADKESLDHQQRLNREHVAKWNGVVVAELEVRGMSRNYILWDDVCEELPAFAQLDDLLRRKAFDILMCMDITRLGRTAALVATLAALCEKAGVRIYECSAPPTTIDGPVTFDTRLLMLFKAGQSEHEVRKFSERATFGRQAQARKGKHANIPPIGLKRVFTEHGEVKTVIDEEWRPIVELFYELYVEHGRSQVRIAEEFNARGYRTPQQLPWEAKSIRVFLRNRWAYAGYVVWGTYSKTPEKAFRTKAEWPPLITEEMAHRAEEEMKKRSRGPRAAGDPQRFSVTAKCNLCGCTLNVHNVAGRQKHPTTTYICLHRCRGSFIREPVLYAAIREAILLLRNEADMETLVGETPEERTDLVALLEETQRALDAVRKERNRLTQAFMREAIEMDEYEPLMAELKQRHDAIAHNVTDLENQIAAVPSAEQRRQRLEEIRDRGLQMLDHPDLLTANAWLRRHFLLYVQKHKVVTIKLY